jgi:uncharacterized protein DUF1592/uncharacterized protein DUF1588/uncharacterized protein DUF1587/uncharacterized protein DUF1585/uncharacterized protein DUF1595/cytochrome c
MRLRKIATGVLAVIAIAVGIWAAGSAQPPVQAEDNSAPGTDNLDVRFARTVHPFLSSYCISCHSGDKPSGGFDLTRYSGTTAVEADLAQWMQVRDKLAARQMPPDNAAAHPSAGARREMIAWIDAARRDAALKDAGDPGVVLARRLSNSEYDYTIRDLTGVDIQPTREFPIDPSNTAGFDNSGESLAMSPELLDKYLKAAREVASHMYLKQQGFGFAARSMLSEADRDQFCEHQIVDFYYSQDIDYADYFQAAWRFKNRAALGTPNASLQDTAASGKVSAKYLRTVWGILEEARDKVGPVAKLQAMWRALPAANPGQPDAARKGCEQMRDFVVGLRKKIEPRFAGLPGAVGQAGPMWVNQQYATHRRTYDKAQLQIQRPGSPAKHPAVVTTALTTALAAAPVTQPATQPALALGRGGGGRGAGARGGRGGRGGGGAITNTPGDPDLVVPANQVAEYEASFAEFCSVFPDRFYTAERGTNYFNIGKEQGRLLSAGFQNRMGYFRDDIPFYELILDKSQQDHLDEMWRDMDFIASATKRTYLQSFDARSAPFRAIMGKDVAPGDELASEANIKKYENGLLARANPNSPGAQATRDHFKMINDAIRWAEKAHLDAEPGQLQALLDFAARAYRRPLTQSDRDDLLSFYKSAREKEAMDHESALRESIVYVLVSPDMTYRIDLASPDKAIHMLTDYELASRLSYFLWASMPDQELLDHAAAGDLHRPEVMIAQTRRMIRDPRIRDMALEFGGNWLDFRRFQDIQSVDRQRFPAFTDELRDAMFEEPVRFLLNVIQDDRSILDCIYANDTFVNPVLAKHYGIPVAATAPDDWVHVEDASPYYRGGILPMAVFLTKNAPGLRTSPVKRGNWVVKNLLGERISPPPQGVPELPHDEAKLDLPLREMLARHRADPNCAACHARFDALGLVFEGYGPVGEWRVKDLAGHPIDASATFPDGGDGTGLAGLRQYIREHRQNDYINTLCGKLLVYALGRSLITADDLMIEQMRQNAAANGYRFETLVETIVTSPQFMTKRGRLAVAENQ